VRPVARRRAQYSLTVHEVGQSPLRKDGGFVLCEHVHLQCPGRASAAASTRFGPSVEFKVPSFGEERELYTVLMRRAEVPSRTLMREGRSSA
jgi:hypothetical protein